MNQFKTAKTIKDFATKYKGWGLVVPAGSPVNNKTACGYNDSYRFLGDVSRFAKHATGHDNSTLKHDLTYYRLNIPAEYCEPYEATKEAPRV